MPISAQKRTEWQKRQTSRGAERSLLEDWTAWLMWLLVPLLGMFPRLGLVYRCPYRWGTFHASLMKSSDGPAERSAKRRRTWRQCRSTAAKACCDPRGREIEAGLCSGTRINIICRRRMSVTPACWRYPRGNAEPSIESKRVEWLLDGLLGMPMRQAKRADEMRYEELSFQCD